MLIITNYEWKIQLIRWKDIRFIKITLILRRFLSALRIIV